MTTFLIGSVSVVGAVAVLNLLLTAAVIRRLRQHSEQLVQMRSIADGSLPMLAVGERMDDFIATTTDGETVTRGQLPAQTLVGMFSPKCAACAERLPAFLDAADVFPGGRAQVLAVIDGPDQVEEYRRQLEPVARVVIEESMAGPLVSALRVRGWPAFLLLDADQRVVANGLSVEDLPLVSPVAA